MFSAPSETFTILCRSRWEATFTLLRRCPGGNFYRISLRARQGAPHTRTGMPIALAVSHTSMHHRAHGVGPAGTTCMATSGSKAWLRRRLHAAIVREYLAGAIPCGTGVPDAVSPATELGN